ncbi:hypothetical protein [Halarcobacter ebronensis]|uniref:Uncharacterized protein n=1 Tax=Halarcobacter ebronensis TaxID=1462615 RepID=A0A4Q1AJ72_9BACT|nr:hypothetical protein [Halarcobacter ebronensis]QKF82051.1 hypothetical protein AEBR_1568 [Halarcobacter ebronensis]RXK04116.1 hypothetical protein CRV07_11865 [Halarcobacter ebronensis]
MIRQNIINNKFVEIKPNDTEQVKMNKYQAYSVQAYSHKITVYHDNAAALDPAITIYDFLANALSKLTLQIGAGNEIYDLDLTAHLVRQLELRKQLVYSIDKTSGTGKISTIQLIIDFLSLDFIAPKDTILFNTGNYDHLLTQIVAAPGTKISNCTVTKTIVGITELFKTDVVLNKYIATDGTTQTMTPLNKKPIMRTPSFNSSNPNWELDIPNNVEISKIMMYVTDGGKISTGHIKNVIIKNATQKLINVDSATLEAWNRETLRDYNDSDFDGILVLNIAQGQYTEALKTTGLFVDSKLEVDVIKGAASEPILNIIYETVEKA